MQSIIEVYRINESEYTALVEFRQENKTQSTALDLENDSTWFGDTVLFDIFPETQKPLDLIAAQSWYKQARMYQTARACQLAIEN